MAERLRERLLGVKGLKVLMFKNALCDSSKKPSALMSTLAPLLAPLVSMLFQAFLTPLKFLMEIFNILVCLVSYTDFNLPI